MTKLEEKLIELGYDKYEERFFVQCAFRNINKCIVIEDNEIMDYFLDNYNFKEQRIMFVRFYNSNQINKLQLAFNQMQRDLEILKECEK